MSKTTRTSKKQIHELEAMARETIDKSARLYARNEYDATGKAYAVINGTRTAYASNTALYDAVADMVLTKQAEEFQPEPEQERKGYAEKTAGYVVAELMDAYVKATGMTWPEYVETHDDEQAQALYRVASVEIIPEPERPAGYETASPEDYAAVAIVVSVIAADPAEHLADAAARALLAEYANAIGEHPTDDDPETRAAYRIAFHDIAHQIGSTASDREIVASMVEAIAQAVRNDMPTGPEGYHAELVRKADAAAVRFCAAYTATTGIVPFFEDAAAVCRVARADVAHEYGVTASDRETVAAMIEELADADRHQQTAEPRPTYQRAELLAYLGEPDDYDVTAIEHEATAYDPATGRTVWAVDADELAIIAERHQLQFYAPAF